MLKKFTQTVILIFGLTVLFTACPNEKSEVVEINYPTRDFNVRKRRKRIQLGT